MLYRNFDFNGRHKIEVEVNNQKLYYRFSGLHRDHPPALELIDNNGLKSKKTYLLARGREMEREVSVKAKEAERRVISPSAEDNSIINSPPPQRKPQANQEPPSGPVKTSNKL